MPVKIEFNKGRVPVRVWTDQVESQAIDQLVNVSRLPVVGPHIAVMPDVHAGIGATVGSVIPTEGAIIPAAVGVDIGCGMAAVRLSLAAEHLPDSLRQLRGAIEDAVPVGFAEHDLGAGHSVPAAVRAAFRARAAGLERILDKAPEIESMAKNARAKAAAQLGTLGGGNHFIELCLDEANRVWVMLHSGSRGIGNLIGRHYIELAKRDMGELMGSLPDKDLAYLRTGTQAYRDYVEAVSWAQDYARANRDAMLDLVLSVLRAHLPGFELTEEAINCHHNYVQEEEHFGRRLQVTRKGAISARAGELGIIPGSMGARSFIVRGLGNAESFCSCSHGAGRRMSRGAAKRVFTRADLEAQTAGVECRKDAAVIDEIPGAYKDIDAVMAQQSDLVEVVHTLKQVLCVKG